MLSEMEMSKWEKYLNPATLLVKLKKRKGVNNPVDAINFFLASILDETENSAV